MRNYKQALYTYIARLRGRYGITDASYPLDIVSMIRAREPTNIVFQEFESPYFCAAAIPGPVQDTIILNTRRGPSQNFDCGHELVHLKKHRDSKHALFSCVELGGVIQGGSPFQEWEANEGSAELLVPYRLFIPFFMAARPDIRSQQDYRRFLRAAADRFGVTPATIRVRFDSLRYAVWQAARGAAIDEVELLSNAQQRARNISCPSVNDLYK